MAWYIPFLIFLGRIGDVSVGTFRTILMLAGYRHWAALLGVLEVAIWVLVAGKAIQYVQQGHLGAVVGYACGFGTGVLVGMWLEDKIALGFRIVRVVCTEDNAHVPERLRALGYRVTQITGRGRDAAVDIAFLVLRRRELPKLNDALAEIAPTAFVTVERVEKPRGAGFGEVAQRGRFNVLRQQVRK